jgi:hypothetical protein
MPLEERERTAEGAKPHETVSYGSNGDQVADMTFPTQRAERAPLVVLFHGGFWRAEHDRLHVRVVADALADCGYAVANVEYRRIGAGGGWPTTFTDVANAVDALPAMIEREHLQDDVVPVDMSRRYHVAFGTELIEVPGGHFDLIDPRSTAWPLVVQALRTIVNGSRVPALRP